MITEETIDIKVDTSVDTSIPFVNFDTLRPAQVYALSEIHKHANRSVHIINAPCGTGKSLILMLADQYLGNARTNYICTSKFLQDQLSKDFCEARVLKGRSNYACHLYPFDYPQITAADCDDKCDDWQDECEYEKNKQEVLHARYRILNLSYLLTEANYIGRFSKQASYMIDECDTLEGELTRFISLDINLLAVQKLIGQDIGKPTRVTKLESWLEWAKAAKDRFEIWLKIHQSYKTAENIKLRKLYKRCDSLHGRFGFFIANVDDTWILNHNQNFLSFKPVWLSPELTKKYLWRHGEKFVLASGTMHQKAIQCKLLGLDLNEVEYTEMSCPFPIENRRTIYDPVPIKMKYDNKDQWVPLVIKKVGEILARHAKQKGIIHTGSYWLRDAIVNELKDPRLVIHGKTNESKVDAINNHKKSAKPTVLISPCFSRGLSLDGEFAEFAIWPKLPWADLSDKTVQQRIYGMGRNNSFGNQWYNSEAAMVFLQGKFRSIRGMSDKSSCYVLDSKFSQIKRWLPKYDQESITMEL